MHEIDQLKACILDGDRDGAVHAVQMLLDRGAPHGKIVTEGIEAAMKELDLKCTAVQFNLLEIMLSGRAVMGVIDELYRQGVPPQPTKGTVVLCAIEGDVHDLGKNIVKIIFTANGYRVIDCGKDCPLEVLVATAKQEEACAVGISGLITTIIGKVREAKNRFLEMGMPDMKILVGGAALKQATAEDLKVDYVAQSVFDGLHYLNGIMGRDKEP